METYKKNGIIVRLDFIRFGHAYFRVWRDGTGNEWERFAGARRMPIDNFREQLDGAKRVFS
jgi:hypothetical protein